MFGQLGLVAALTLLPSVSFAQITNDFESGWDQTAWPIYAPDCNQGGVVALDSTVAHSGKNSIKVTGAGGYCGHIFFGTKAVPAGDVYVRVWLQAQKALTSNHVSFLTMPDSSQGANENLRFGGQNGIMMYNRQSDDATLPDLSPQGVASSEALPTGAWECLEYHLGSDGTIETWLNSAVIPGLTIKSGVANPNDNGFAGKGTYIPKITGVYFGWESYGGDVNTFWYDDIAIASTRVGCGATTGGPAPPPPASSSSVVAPPKSTSTSIVVPPKSSSTVVVVPPKTTLVTSTSTTSAVTTPSGCASPHYGQCGGIGWAGCLSCAAGTTCKSSGPYYSQCL
ncbi:hypothetical protein MMC25_004188 [Agyrium rufum]|nr:hypothetical protein [Agyrium rufum]